MSLLPCRGAAGLGAPRLALRWSSFSPGATRAPIGWGFGWPPDCSRARAAEVLAHASRCGHLCGRLWFSFLFGLWCPVALHGLLWALAGWRRHLVMVTQTTVCGRTWGVQHRTTYIGIRTEGGGKDWLACSLWADTRKLWGVALCLRLDYYWGWGVIWKVKVQTWVLDFWN